MWDSLYTHTCQSYWGHHRKFESMESTNSILLSIVLGFTSFFIESSYKHDHYIWAIRFPPHFDFHNYVEIFWLVWLVDCPSWFGLPLIDVVGEVSFVYFILFYKKKLQFYYIGEAKSANIATLKCEGISSVHTNKLVTCLACLAKLRVTELTWRSVHVKS